MGKMMACKVENSTGILISLRGLLHRMLKEGWKRSAGAMLESFIRGDRELVLADEIFKKSDQLFLGYIPAVGFWKKGEIGDRSIRVEIQVKP